MWSVGRGTLFVPNLPSVLDLPRLHRRLVRLPLRLVLGRLLGREPRPILLPTVVADELRQCREQLVLGDAVALQPPPVAARTHQRTLGFGRAEPERGQLAGCVGKAGGRPCPLASPFGTGAGRLGAARPSLPSLRQAWVG